MRIPLPHLVMGERAIKGEELAIYGAGVGGS